MTATFHVGDAIEVMSKLPEKSVDLILTSPPFLALRSYLPADHPDKGKEGGSQSTPGEFIDWLLDVVEACARVLAPHGSLCVELGDTYSGTGGAGGDWSDSPATTKARVKGGSDAGPPRRSGLANYSDDRGNPDGMRDTTFSGGNTKTGGGTGWPLAKSLSLIPESFRFAMVYGFNPHTGRTTAPWRLRNVIRWVRPNPPVGALGDKFRPATSELMVFCKSAKRYFDLDSVREPFSRDYEGERRGAAKFDDRPNGSGYDPALMGAELKMTHSGAPPLDWWNIPLPCETCAGRGWSAADISCPGCGGTGLLEGEEPTRYGPKTRDRSDRQDSGGRPGMPKGVGNMSAETYGSGLNPLGAPPLDWWNIPPGGYEGAHYAVWPPELCVKPVKAMCPEKVCRQCGEPSRRIVAGLNEERQRIATLIGARREGLGLQRRDLLPLFIDHYKNADSVLAQISNWELAKNVPIPHDWQLLKGRLGIDTDEFDELIEAESRWNDAEYVHISDHPSGNTQDANGRVYQRLPARKDRISPERFSDCGCVCPACDGHGTFTNPGASERESLEGLREEPCPDCGGSGEHGWRSGLVLDPFAGSGTTLAVATGHGRDAIGIDLDARNFDLALERVGPFILERAS